MTISRLLMPAVTLAGALALAGCGGGSGTPAGNGNGDNNGDDDNGKVTLTDAICGTGRMVNDAGTECVADPDYTSAKEARDTATALYGNIDTASVPTGETAIPSEVKTANQSTESFRGEGQSLADLDNVAAAASSGANEGYHAITGGNGNNHEVTSSQFTKTPGSRTIPVGTYAGNYRSVPGMFRCTTAEGCSVRYRGEDDFELAATGWHFKPTAEDAKVEGPKIAEWGWWIEDPDDKTKDEVSLVYRIIDAGDNDPDRSTLAAINGLNGSATYTGDALGQYAIVRSGTGSASGKFEAKAELTAEFSDATKLSGKIHDFNVGSGWEVTLKEKAIAENDVPQPVIAGGTTTWKIGDTESITEGAWNADIYGGNATSIPTHILGGFTATHTDARMVGAFGTKAPEDD